MSTLLELLPQYMTIVPFQLGKPIGSGQDGVVYELSNSKERVVKLSIHLLIDAETKPFKQILKELKLIQENTPIHLVRIHNFGSLITGRYEMLPYIVYWTEMERLFSLSEDESKVVHTILSHEDAKKPKNYTREALDKTLAELSAWLDCDMDRMATFYSTIQTSPIRHQDIHPRNVMKDRGGNFKLVDLNRITIAKAE